jgi:hypothetical protein
MIVGVRGDHLWKFLDDLRRVRAANENVRKEDEARRDRAIHPYVPVPIPATPPGPVGPPSGPTGPVT